MTGALAGGHSGGLDGVEVADTALSRVDGEQGRLVIAGHDLEALAGRVTFEEVCGLLWGGELPEDRSGSASGPPSPRGERRGEQLTVGGVAGGVPTSANSASPDG